METATSTERFRSYVWPERNPGEVRAKSLGREMVELCAHLNAAEARFLELLAQFDREGLWT